MRKPDTSAVSTERLRTWRRSTSGSAERSSNGIQAASRIADAAIRPSDRAEDQPHSPPSLRTTETPATTRLSNPAPATSKAPDQWAARKPRAWASSPLGARQGRDERGAEARHHGQQGSGQHE